MCLEYLRNTHAFGSREVLSYDAGRLFVSGFQRCQERFGLSPEMVEIWAGWEVLIHNQFLKTRRDPQTGSTINVRLIVIVN